ncbi:hypothetical protein [Bradyrhizobium pachyrhizi]|uniref:hypothetical protein n=1 Tax=Bradyrhizobium pachyrhizi TaxID=280333 RepID=UPI001364E0D2|nr:hypothetical protein [Bradyrhizobium pachyrhizi]
MATNGDESLACSAHAGVRVALVGVTTAFSDATISSAEMRGDAERLLQTPSNFSLRLRAAAAFAGRSAKNIQLSI